jgi:hypothetical protein
MSLQHVTSNKEQGKGGQRQQPQILTFRPPAQGSKEAGNSKLHLAVKKYPDVESIKWSKDCPKNMKEASILYQTGSSGNFPIT